MTEAQLAVLSRISYLNRPTKNGQPVQTLLELVECYESNVSGMLDKKAYTEAFAMIRADDTLSDLKISAFERKDSGFAAYCFKTISGDPVVAFRGTEWTDKGDIANDLSGQVEVLSRQQQDAIDFMKDKVYDFNKSQNVEVTGHSLGGQLAQTVTVLHDRVNNCVTFNAPGVSSSFKKYYDYRLTDENINKITAYRASGDPVSYFGSNIKDPITVNDIGDGKIQHGSNHGMDLFIRHYYNNGGYGQTCPPEQNSGLFTGSGGSGGFRGAGVAAVAVPALIGGNSAQRIKADPAQLQSLSQKLSSLSIKFQDLKTQLQSTANNLDWKVASKQGIEDRISSAVKSMNTQCEKLEKYGKAVETVCDRMTTADSSISQQCKGLQYMMDKIIVRSEMLPKTHLPQNYSSGIPFLNPPAPLPTADLTLTKHNAGIEKKDSTGGKINLLKILKIGKGIVSNPLSTLEYGANLGILIRAYYDTLRFDNATRSYSVDEILNAANGIGVDVSL